MLDLILDFAKNKLIAQVSKIFTNVTSVDLDYKFMILNKSYKDWTIFKGKILNTKTNTNYMILKIQPRAKIINFDVPRIEFGDINGFEAAKTNGLIFSNIIEDQLPRMTILVSIKNDYICNIMIDMLPKVKLHFLFNYPETLSPNF